MMKFSEIPDYFVCQISTFSGAAKIVFPLSPAPNDRSLLARTVISFLFRGRINTGTPVEFGISLITMQEEREREKKSETAKERGKGCAAIKRKRLRRRTNSAL